MAKWSLQNLFLQKYILLILQDISSNLHIPQFSLYSVISSPRSQQRGSTDRGTWLNINMIFMCLEILEVKILSIQMDIVKNQKKYMPLKRKKFV